MKLKWTIILLFIGLTVKAQYIVKINTHHITDTLAYFRGSIFDEKNFTIKDTLHFKNETASILFKKPIIGGIYFLYFPKSSQKIYLTIDNLDNFKIDIYGNDSSNYNYLKNIKTNSKSNQIFFEYQNAYASFNKMDTDYNAFIKEGIKYNIATTAQFFKPRTDSLMHFRNKALKQLQPKDILYLHFSTINKLDSFIPNNKNWLLRNQYFSKYNLNESKLFFGPNLKQIILDYLNCFPQNGDSLFIAADSILSHLDCKNKAYPFAFEYLSKILSNRNVNNNTNGYSKLIEKYIVNGKCNFIDTLKKNNYLKQIERYQKQSNLDTCLNIILKDTTGTTKNLHEFAKDYNFTVLIFYAPTCEHCQKEVPLMDSTIKALEKTFHIKIGRYAICNEVGVTKLHWTNFIEKHQLNTHYEHVQLGLEDTAVRNFYDAYSNPIFYLIDSKSKLLAKKISPNTLRKNILNPGK